jgi:hypothetical protein
MALVILAIVANLKKTRERKKEKNTKGRLL